MEISEKKKNIVLGVIAHVDAGKTTLCEALLYLTGAIRRQGRVDHGDCQLDYNDLERSRGITIFSKLASVSLENTFVTLLDTPGHIDFSAEAERAIRVMDYAVLVISGTDGVQAHTETVWRLLQHYGVPCFVFVTKMDLPTCDKTAVLQELQASLSRECIDFTLPDTERDEQLAVCGDAAMDEYLQHGSLPDETIAALIRERSAFPCYFGSGLKNTGVPDFLAGLDRFTLENAAEPAFGAVCYKIEHDAQGALLAYLKLTGGSLNVRDAITYSDRSGVQHTEKINRIFLPLAARLSPAPCALQNDVAVVTGLSGAYPGLTLGSCAAAPDVFTEPVMQYRIVLPDKTDAVTALPALQQLNAEAPELSIQGNTRTGVITVCLMGKVQEEIFKSIVKQRFGWELRLDTGHILYKETIANTVEGVGHYEPLRHYAEAHLLMEPRPLGSGILLTSTVSENELDRNWQRLILTHLAEKTHLGVLTGAPLTDVKITLAAGRAHLKHTEGGDFREATYRAVRQGLMQAESVLLEPTYRFTLTVPTENLGRAITDLRSMNAKFEVPPATESRVSIEGSCPVASISSYAAELVSYTHGKGRLSLSPGGYCPCHDTDKVVAAAAYSPEADLENSPDSVFCAHGGGFTVKWNKVPEYMHLDSCLPRTRQAYQPVLPQRRQSIDDRELEAIMEREFGPIRRREYSAPVKNEAVPGPAVVPKRREHLIVDGYNVIFSSPELKALAEDSLDSARARLMDLLAGYCGFTGDELVLVFDGFRTKGNPGSRSEYHNIHVVYTKDGESADAYIEALAADIGKNYGVRIVTNDNLIRVSAMKSGVLRSSSELFWAELQQVHEQIGKVLEKSTEGAHAVKLKDGIQQ